MDEGPGREVRGMCLPLSWGGGGGLPSLSSPHESRTGPGGVLGWSRLGHTCPRGGCFTSPASAQDAVARTEGPGAVMRWGLPGAVQERPRCRSLEGMWLGGCVLGRPGEMGRSGGS